MKIALVLVAVIGLACAGPLQPRNTFSLRDDINDYLALLPMDKLIALHEKAKQDPEALAARNRVVAYLEGEEFAAIAHIIAHNDQIQDLVNYLENEGLHVKELLNKIAERLGLPPWPTTFGIRGSVPASSLRSLQSIHEEFLALIPVEDIIALTLDKLANSESFQNLYMKISSMDGQKLHDDALSHPEIQSLVQRLNELGVDTKKIWAALQSIFGWGSSRVRSVSTFSLRDDINDYLALLPMDKLIALHEKAKQDPEALEVRTRVVAYMHSEEFAAIAHIVAHNDQIQDLVNYLENEGLHVKEVLNKLADALGLPHWPTTFGVRGPTPVGGLRSLQSIVDEFLALLPTEDLIALTLDKLANSESFQNLYMKISSMDGQKLHDDALSHPEIQSLVQRLNGLGVDTKKIWAALQSIFGWGASRVRSASTFSLRDDINDYLALLPMAQLIALHEKAKQDPEALAARTRVVEYMHSEEFAAIAHIVAHNDQIQDLVDYLENEGLHVKEVLNKLADALGLPHWPTTFAVRGPAPVGGLRSLQSIVDEFLALIPTEDLIALTLDKLANSESFQNLYMKISSMDGQKLHDDALSHPEIQSLVTRLNGLGVDTKKIWEALKAIFGW